MLSVPSQSVTYNLVLIPYTTPPQSSVQNVIYGVIKGADHDYGVYFSI